MRLCSKYIKRSMLYVFEVNVQPLIINVIFGHKPATTICQILCLKDFCMFQSILLFFFRLGGGILSDHIERVVYNYLL